MSDSLPILLENSIQIAWDYLERTREIDDGSVASQFLAGTIEHMIRSGERRRLILSNRAITAYQRFRREPKVA
jgi:hypothetical protein